MDVDFYDYEEDAPCPRCMGDGTIICHCGGDLCVCANYGDAPCPVCHGEGSVSEEREAAFLKAEAEAAKWSQKFWASLSKHTQKGGDA